MLPDVDWARKILRVRRQAAVLFALLASCAGPPPSGAAAGPRAARAARRRCGPERGGTGYVERYAAAKAALFRKINAERAAVGAPPLGYDLLGARVGDDFCLDAATEGSVGHWDTRGRAPYLRWAEAGGCDYHSQNFASQSRIGDAIRESPESLLLSSHALMMAEKPPDDGHRRTVLDPIWTHAGIGAATVGGEFRMTEEFSRRVMEWIEVPAWPLPPRSRALFSARFLPGWNAGPVEIAYEPPPRPLSLREIGRRGSYQYPRTVRTFVPRLPEGLRWAGGDQGDFRIDPSGRIDVFVPLESGPGSYYVLVYAGKGAVSGKRLTPGTAARIVAE
jgi:uncharacterized protein YkwD